MVSKLIFLSPAHPLRGGIAASTERLAREFLDRGAAVRIYSFRVQYPALLFPGKTQYTDDPAPEGLDIEPVLHSVSPANWWQVGRRLQREKPELVISRYWLPFMGPCLGTVQRLARRNGHTRVLGLVDNLIPHERRFGDLPLTRYYLRATDGFVAMSRSVWEDIRRHAPGKPAAYTPHPIYDNYGPKSERAAALARLELPAERAYLLFFGFVRAYKGLDLLLEALGRPELRELPLDLIVAGEFYEDPAPYCDQIDRLGLSRRVHLFDRYIPKEEVRHFFAAANLVTQPYKSATQSGITQLAYQFERPMLVSEVGGLPEIVEHGKTGYVVAPEPGAIAAGILDFFEHGWEAEMTREVARQKHRFSWEKLADTLLAVYEELPRS
jgi:glycosyltransferase involved in cell wall biosynthesis